MKWFKSKKFLFWMICVFLLASCSNKTESEIKEPVKKSKAASEEKQEIPKQQGH
jgi:protein involved in sex pheromone biosynthesis